MPELPDQRTARTASGVRTRFVLAFDPGYASMATALVRSLEHFHPGRPIRVYTLPEHTAKLAAWARAFRVSPVEIVAYHADAELSFGEWHPLIWAKLEAFAADVGEYQIVLDVDQILYREIDDCLDEAVRAGKTIAASPDITDLRGHVHASFSYRHDLEAMRGIPCFNAGAMIIRPSRRAYRELRELARRHHEHVRLPEQAILNLWARSAGEHHDLGEQLMLQPWSPRLLEAEVPSCLVHFWTPRPAFFGASPRRATEPAFQECLDEFQRVNGARYPLERFERDFLARLHGTIGAAAA